MTSGADAEAFGGEVDTVLEELGWTRKRGEETSEWSIPNPEVVFERTRNLVASFAALAQFAIGAAAAKQRIIDTEGEDAEPDEDSESDRHADLEILRGCTDLLTEVRRTHFFKRPDPGE